ncbi:1-acyl-sn-glycerol-3-phosphate acyltransferase [Microbulbifer sp. TYP-18]|uniref:1-acyl-sn-glycerol-3-phosphate acyltransferase n=1 Tax=Microbulbifer sp. TYP-18 TaxID=3230024 RepID=UPI0034C5B9A9
MPTIPKQLPAEVPRIKSRLVGALGLLIVKLLGWRFDGQLPAQKKVMVALAPHTSNWDFVVAMPFIMALRVRVFFMMKKEAFFFPFKSLFMALGGLPTDRKAPGGIAQQMANAYRQNDKMWVAITPEGTRNKVDKWKNGFLRIAYAADVPILLVAWDFANKRICVDSLYHPVGNLDQDMMEIQRRFSRYRGCNPDKQTDFTGGE